MLEHPHHQEAAMNLHNTAIGARLVTTTLASLALIISLWAGPAGAAEAMLNVYMNHARVLKLDRPVSKVIVGNSEVADATVADAKTIVLTGRSFGTTNLVILDVDGNAMVDERILVSIDEGNTVRVFKQTIRSVLSCTPNCEEHATHKLTIAN
jgi:Flp pilus assembly secretin CpaC